MFLERLQLNNFKNYIENDIQFSSKINCFVGNNGVGKTNILDAIYYLSYCKSYFSSTDWQNIRHEQDYFSIHGTYLINEQENKDLVSCILKKNQRKVFKINKKEYPRLSEHIGLIPLVMVSPYDIDLINEGSEYRRKYIDSVIIQFDKNYLNDIINYNKILTQRNALLKQFYETNRFDKNSLELWDEQMVLLGEKIFEKRKSFINDFINVIRQYFQKISGLNEVISIVYESHLNDNNFYDLLKKVLDNDRNSQYSTVGIHKDDFQFLLNNYPLKKFGSQGQQKTFLVALKLSQFEYTSNIKKINPILLLDDIFDKLDDNRVSFLIKLVGDNKFGQVFITDTQSDRIKRIFENYQIEHSIFQISETQLNKVIL